MLNVVITVVLIILLLIILFISVGLYRKKRFQKQQSFNADPWDCLADMGDSTNLDASLAIDDFDGGNIPLGMRCEEITIQDSTGPLPKQAKKVDFNASQKATEIDAVQFRIAAPAKLEPDTSVLVKFMAFLEQELDRVDRDTKKLAEEVRENNSGLFDLQRNTKLTIILQSRDVVIEDDYAEILWNGRYASCDFYLDIPENYTKKTIRLNARVYIQDEMLTDLKLVLNVQTTGEQVVLFDKTTFKSAFISYASSDRAEVAARLQGILLARPDMDLFFDIRCLQRGEHWEERLYREIDSRNLFYLFWSRNAAKSEWVMRELSHALSTKPSNCIEPIPLESPDICPPPKGLEDRHFNDWTLLYQQNQDVRSHLADVLFKNGASYLFHLERHVMFELTEMPFSFGSANTNTYQLEDPHISREHFQIQKNGSQYQITNLSATAGLIVDDQKLDAKTENSTNQNHTVVLQAGSMIVAATEHFIYVGP